MRLFQFILRLLREQPLRLSLVVVTLSLSSLLEGFSLASLIPLIDMINNKGTTSGEIGKIIQNLLIILKLPFNLFTILLFILLVIFTQLVVALIQEKLSYGSIYRFEASLRKRLYEDIFGAAWPFFLQEKTGNLTNALTVEAQRAGQAYRGLVSILGTGVVLIVYASLAFYLSWKMAAIATFIGLISVLVLRKRVSMGSGFGKKITQANSELQVEAVEHVSGAKLIKGYAAEKTVVARFSRILNFLAHEQYKKYMNQAWVGFLFDLVSVISILLGIYFAVSFLKITVSSLIVFIFLFYRLSPRVSNLQKGYHDILGLLPALDRIDELSGKALSFQEDSGQMTKSRFEEKIVFNKVSFCYQPPRYVLKDLSLEVPKGETTAIVGPSGAGKTTAVDLVMGLIVPQSGEILIDRTPLRELEIHEWRGKIGYLPQDPVFFHASVKDNIAWVCPNVPDSDIKQAAKLAYAHEFIEQLPEGYDTIIGDRGVKLSGGQKQRVALARALIREPDILVLDEATSALDAESEKKIQRAIKKLSQNMAVIIVTHRLATVKDAHTIYFLEKGRLVEKGTWEELIERKGRFDELRKLQELA